MHADDVGPRSDPASGNPVRLTLTEAYRHAVALHHSGELAQAGSLYVAILSASPDHLGALQALGMLEAQRGNLQQAERLLGRARELDPQSAKASASHANVLRMQRRFEQALAGYDASLAIRPDVVELHTGTYANARSYGEQEALLEEIRKAARLARELGLAVNAGHGLNYTNIIRFREIEEIEEVSIGHAVIARAVFVGLDRAVRDMVALLR